MTNTIRTLTATAAIIAALAATAHDADAAGNRRDTATALAAVPAVAARAVAPDAAPIALKSGSIVSGPRLRLSDLFDGVPEGLDTEIGAAPQPGQRQTVTVDSLERHAAAAGLSWKTRTGRERVVVERAATSVPDAEVRAAVERALMSGHVRDDVEVDLANSSARLVVAPGEQTSVKVHDLAYDERTRSFSAVVSAPADDPSAPRSRVNGRVFAVAQIPVLARHAMPGEIIRAQDITWQRIRTHYSNFNTVTGADQLVGYSVRRPIVAGQMIRRTDVVQQTLIRKGELITVTFRTPYMVLSTRAEALEDGAKGETIRLRNTQSKRVIQAEVMADGSVVIESKRSVALN